MKAILKKVGEEPAIVFKELTLKFLQEAVGGYIECVPIGPDVSVYCNEDGIALGLKPNCCGFLGDIIISATDADTGEPRSLTKAEIRKALAWLDKFAALEQPGEGAVEIRSGEEARRRLLEERCELQEIWKAL